MRIVVDVNGFYDWAPAPAGTQITEEDVKSLRVKQMSDDKWHIKVEMKAPEGGTHHDVGIHEEQIARRMAAMWKTGKTPSREDIVVSELQEAFRHHLSRSHMDKITVVDDGPVEAVLKAALVAIEIPEDKHEEILTMYMEENDLGAYLNTVFKTKASKAPKAKKGGK